MVHPANAAVELSQVRGLTEAAELARGKKAGTRVTVIEVPDVRAIRRRLHMSQHEFADASRIPLATIKNWDRAPCTDALAAAYLAP